MSKISGEINGLVKPIKVKLNKIMVIISDIMSVDYLRQSASGPYRWVEILYRNRTAVTANFVWTLTPHAIHYNSTIVTSADLNPPIDMADIWESQVDRVSSFKRGERMTI